MAKDIFHDAVKQGLLKQGWTVTHDPYIIKLIVYGINQETVLSWKK